MSAGWVKFHRQALESHVWGHPIRWAVFSYLLLSCNREPGTNRYYGYEINAGECDHSIRRIAESIGASKDAVQRALVQLESHGTVRREKRHKARQAPDVVTLVKWGLYNGDGKSCDTDRDANCDTEKDILEKKREAKKKESISSDQKRTNQYTEAFERFWDVWPDKSSGKAAAFKCWEKLTPEQHVVVLASGQKLAALWRNAPRPLQYFPNVTTWFNQGRWEAAEQRGPSQNGQPKKVGQIFGGITDIDDDDYEREAKEHAAKVVRAREALRLERESQDRDAV